MKRFRISEPTSRAKKATRGSEFLNPENLKSINI
jgi:hypothetical protein